MDNFEIERKKKQQFLYSEIIEAGYDAGLFQEFLNKKKPNGGSNVDLWTFSELSQLIKDFRRSIDDKEVPEHNEEENDSKSTKSIDEKKEKKEENKENNLKFLPIKKTIENPVLYDDENYQKSIICKELSKIEILDIANVKISIPDFEIVPGGIFSSSYANFKIITSPLDWEVKRRYSDFSWLRTHLLKLYPGIFIPPIPIKKATRCFDQLYLNKRKAFLEKFLQDSLRNNLIRNTQIFVEFISLKDDLAFQVKKKDANNKKSPEKLEQHSNPTGKVELSINEDITTYMKYISEYIGDADALYLKLRKLNNQLLLDFDQVSTTLFQMGDVFENLYQKSNKFNNNVTVNKNFKIDDIYITLNNMTVNWGNSIVHQMGIIQENLCNFFKYEKHYNFCMKEILKERNNFCNDYYRAKNREQKKIADSQKEKKFIDMNFSSIFQKDVNLAFMKDNFAFYNHQASIDLPRCLDLKCDKYMNNFIEFGKSQTEVVTEMHLNWAEVISHFEEIYGNIKGFGSLSLKKGEHFAKKISSQE